MELLKQCKKENDNEIMTLMTVSYKFFYFMHLLSHILPGLSFSVPEPGGWGGALLRPFRL